MDAILERLVDANINLLPAADIATHFIFERDGFIALVERHRDGFGAIGSAGLLSGKGLAPIVWKNGMAWFVAKGIEEPATPEQVERLRRFQSDLETALAGPGSAVI